MVRRSGICWPPPGTCSPPSARAIPRLITGGNPFTGAQTAAEQMKKLMVSLWDPSFEPDENVDGLIVGPPFWPRGET